MASTTTLRAIFQDVARRFPQQTAVNCGALSLTYAQLADRAERIAGLLCKECRNPQAGVALVLANGIEFVETFWACVAAGIPVAPLDPNTPADALRAVLREMHPALLITDTEGCEELKTWRGFELPPVINAQAWPQWPAAQAEGAWPATNAAAPAVYLWTSGSSGKSQRVCRTHGQLAIEATNFVGTAGLGPADNFLGVLPLHHSYGLEISLLGAMVAGTSLVLLPAYDAHGRRVKAPFVARCHEVVALIASQAARVFPGVPQQFSELAQLPKGSNADLTGLKLVISSASPLPRDVFNRFLARFGKPIRQSYGSTEAGTVTLNLDPQEVLRPESVGRPVNNVEVAIANDAGDLLAEGQVGSVLIRTPVVEQHRGDFSAAAGPARYYRSGDLGYLDGAGRLYVVDRISSLIDWGGHKIDPRRVERVLLEHPNVRDAAVYLENVECLEPALVAAVVAVDDADLSALTTFAKEMLAPFELPRHVVELPAIPRGALGKVHLTALQAAVRPRLALLAAQAAPTPAHSSLVGLNAVDRQNVLQAHLRTKVAELLGRAVDEIPTDGRLQDLGFDSVRATEFRAWLEQWLGMDVPITVVWNSANLRQCAEALSQLLQAGAAQPIVATPPLHPMPGLLLGALDELSDSEIFDRLSKRAGGA